MRCSRPDQTAWSGASPHAPEFHTNPEVFALNQKFAGVNWYRHHLGELKTVDASQTRVAEHERKAPPK